MSMIQSIKDFMHNCPLLDETGNVKANVLATEPVAYIVEEVMSEPILKKYIDGTSICQRVFTFSSKESYNSNDLHEMLATDFCEKLADWFEKQTLKHELPILTEGMNAQVIETITTAYGLKIEDTSNTAQYQIRCKLTYLKEKLT